LMARIPSHQSDTKLSIASSVPETERVPPALLGRGRFIFSFASTERPEAKIERIVPPEEPSVTAQVRGCPRAKQQ
jgi:hypothetical protein